MSKCSFSFIVISQEDNMFLKKCIKSILKQNHSNFEIIIITDKNISDEIYLDNRIKKIVSINNKPSYKRNIGLSNSKNDWIIFIDDDSYINHNYLTVLEHDLEKFKKDSLFLGFGGPGILPEDDNYFSKILDCFFSSFFGTSAKERYSIPQKNHFRINDWLSANLVLKREKLKGQKFDENYWPGEDTQLMSNLLSGQNYLIFNKNIFNYHYRRGEFIKHIRQIFRYGNFRGHLIIINFNYKYIKFYLASLHILFLILSLILSLQDYSVGLVYPLFYITICMLYFFECVMINKKKILISLFSVPIFIFSHLTYNVGLLKGILFGRPKIKLGR